MLKLYGVPLSQPLRSVAWACLQQRVPFQVVITVPGIAAKSGSRNEAFLAKNPAGTVPLLEEPETGLTLAESPAILAYLADKHGWHDLYPPELTARAKINSFMHWHHTGTRRLAQCFGPHVRADMKTTDEELAKRDEDARRILDLFSRAWLGETETGFVAGSPTPSVADLLAYEEVAQLLPEYVNVGPDVGDFPRVLSWVERMKGVAEYEPAHTVLRELGDLVAPNPTSLPKRLGAATKAGLQAFAKAQESW